MGKKTSSGSKAKNGEANRANPSHTERKTIDKRNELGIQENLDQKVHYSLDVSKDLFQSSLNDENENQEEDDPNDEMFDKLQKDLEEVNIEIGGNADAHKEDDGASSSKEAGS